MSALFCLHCIALQDFPHELMTTLVEKLHGKPDKREDVVNAFVAQHPLCTKKAVSIITKTNIRYEAIAL